MNGIIISFLVVGVLFGLTTYSIRHLFSEGSVSRSDNGERGPMDGRVMWVAISLFLWPILMLTGLYTQIYKYGVRARAQRERSASHG